MRIHHILTAVTLFACTSVALGQSYTPGTPTETSGTGTLSISAPARDAGNVILVGSASRGTGGTLTDPTGFTRLKDTDTATTPNAGLWCRIASDTSADDWSGDWSGTDFSEAVMVVLSGDEWDDCADIVAHSNDRFSSSGNVNYPSLTITTDNTFVVIYAAKFKSATSNDNAFTGTEDGFTEIDTTVHAGTALARVFAGVQQTTATNISIGSFGLVSGTSESTSSYSVIVALQTSAASPPVFEGGPTVTAIDNNTFRVTYDADATADAIFCGAWAKDATAPTAAQIEAGTGAHGAGTEAATGSSDTLDFDVTDSPAFPIYDVYCALEEGTSNYSTVGTQVDEYLTPAAGYQFITLASIGTGSPCESFNTAVNPDLVAGDIIVPPTTTSPGSFAFTVGTDCQASYTGDDSRQSALNWKLYDVSAAGIHADDIDFWANNQAPTCIGPFAQVIKTDEAMTNIVIANDTGSLCEDAESDELTTTLTVGTLPTGTSLSGTGNGTLGGTPTVENESGVLLTFTVTDIAGDTATHAIDKLYPITSWTLPDCTTTPLDAASCAGTIEALTIESVTVSSTYECSTTVDPNYVISQNPAAMAEIAPFSTVDLVVAKTCGGGGRLRLNLDLRL